MFTHGSESEREKNCARNKGCVLARNGKASSSTSASTPATSASNDAEWICAKCSAPWQDDGDDRWIVCDRYDKQYHLQCYGIQYRRQDYYTLDIEHMPFTCDAC